MKADLIIKSKNIFDSIQDEPFEGYVAIKDGRILSVGSTHEIMKELIGEYTEIHDAEDRLVMPGFHDSHTHLTLAGMYKTYANLGNAESEEEAAFMLKKFCDEHPSEGWIYGFNWYHVFWNIKNLPQKETLDKYFPDRPVLLINAEAHGAWVNSKALEEAGITDSTPDPFGGEIKRNDKGEATGFLYEAAMSLVVKHALVFSPEQEKEYLRKYMSDAARLGITSVVDVQPYFGMELGSLDVYSRMENDGELTVRITAAGDLLGNLDKAVENSRKYRTDMLRAHMLKQFVDGVFTTHTALLFDDYSDNPGNRGAKLFELDKIESAVYEAHRRGLSVKIHAIGDRAVNFVLNCYEKAISDFGNTGSRHAIEHAELILRDDLERFRTLHIIPSIQPEHIGLMPTWDGEEYRIVLGEARANLTWPLKTLLEKAGLLAVGSDCPVVDNNPFYAIHRGITRLHDDGLPEGGWNPSEKLTLSQVLKGYTIGSAYGTGRENELGTLEAGKFADIIVVNGNLFEMTPEEIRQAKVDKTLMNGKIIYNANKDF